MEMRLCATCDVVVPTEGTHPEEWMCSGRDCGVWFHVVTPETDVCPECGAVPLA